MTKSVVISNTSNWHGENVKIEGAGLVKDGKVVNDNFVILKPGESVQVGPLGYAGVKVIDVCEKTIAPFNHEGKQALPESRMAWMKQNESNNGWRDMDADAIAEIKPNMDSAHTNP